MSLKTSTVIAPFNPNPKSEITPDKKKTNKSKRKPHPSKQEGLRSNVWGNWKKLALDFIASTVFYFGLGLTVFRLGARSGVANQERKTIEGPLGSILNPVNQITDKLMEPLNQKTQDLSDFFTARKEVWGIIRSKLKNPDIDILDELGDETPLFDKDGNKFSLKEIWNFLEDQNNFDNSTDLVKNGVLKEKFVEKFKQESENSEKWELLIDHVISKKRSESDKFFAKVCESFGVYKSLKEKNSLHSKFVRFLHEHPRKVALSMITAFSFLRMFLTNSLNPVSIISTMLCNAACFASYGLNEVNLEALQWIRDLLKNLGLKNLDLLQISNILSIIGDFSAQTSKVIGSAVRSYDDGSFFEDLKEDPSAVLPSLVGAGSVRVFRNFLEGELLGINESKTGLNLFLPMSARKSVARVVAKKTVLPFVKKSSDWLKHTKRQEQSGSLTLASSG